MDALLFLMIFLGVVSVAMVIVFIYTCYAPATTTDPPPPPPPSSGPVPPSAAQVELIQQLARHSYHGEPDLECAICQEVMAEGDSCSGMPICGHVFHSDCLRGVADEVAQLSDV